MRVFIPLIFLTLVVSASFTFAAPTAKTKLETLPLTGESDPYLTDSASPLRTPAPDWFISTGISYESGNILERDEWLQGFSGILRVAPIGVHQVPIIDYQIEFTSSNKMGLFVSKRWYCCESDPFNPYLRLSAGTYLDPSDEIGNLVAIKRLRARGSVGIGEDFFFEAGFGLAVTGPDLNALFGYNFRY